MMEIFYGKLRNGKTDGAMRRILKALAAGQYVFTNVDVIWDGCVEYCRSVYGLEIEEKQLVRLTQDMISRFDLVVGWGTPDCPVLVVLDEIHLWFNARDYKNASRDLLNFLTQSGKAAVDIILISQHPDNVDAQIRRQTQYYVKFRDMQKLHIQGLGFKWPLPQFKVTVFDEDGKTPTDWKLVWKDRRVWACYKTLSFLNGGERTDRLLRAKLRKTGAWDRVKSWWSMQLLARDTGKVKHAQ